MKVLVAGRNGQLARALKEIDLPDTDWQVKAMGRPELDLSDPATLREQIEAFAPDIVINTAAYTAVDKAEDEPEAAHAINAIGAGNLAKATAEAGIPILHISTDYVFSGEGKTARVETDPPSPVNVYGSSKLAGEKAVAEANPRHLIVRTSWLYSPFGHNFVTTMLRLGGERDELTVVDDQTGSPTYAFDLAEALIAITGQVVGRPEGDSVWGIYHLANSDTATWFDFAGEIFRQASGHGFNTPKLTPVTFDQFPTPAARPAYSVLDCKKAQDVFGIRLRDWHEAVSDCITRLARDDGRSG